MPRATKTVTPDPDPVRSVEAFGQVLKGLRKKIRDRSVQDVVRLLHGRLPTIETNQGTVSGYEQGYNKRPDPVVLWGLAKLYQVPTDGLIAVLYANRTDPGLTRAAAERILDEHSHGPSPEVAAAAIKAVRQRLFDAIGDIEAIQEGLRREPPHSRG